MTRRLVTATLVLGFVVGGPAATALASSEGQDHIICVINQDRDPNSVQHGVCLVIPGRI